MAKGRLISPPSGGMVERWGVVGTGMIAIYTLLTLAPIATLGVGSVLLWYLFREAETFQPKHVADELNEILNAKTVKHKSIKEEQKKGILSNYPVSAVNKAIESMVGDTGWVLFTPKDKHPLAKFGECYCWINPHDPMDVKLPIQRVMELLEEWDIEPLDGVKTIDVLAKEPMPTVENKTLELPVFDFTTPTANANTNSQPTALEALLGAEPNAPTLLSTPTPTANTTNANSQQENPTPTIEMPTPTDNANTTPIIPGFPTQLASVEEVPIVEKPSGLAFLESLSDLPLRPAIVAGLPGSGKGILLALAMSLAVKYKGAEAWVFTPKPKLTEAGYWARASRLYLVDGFDLQADLFTPLMEVLGEFAGEARKRCEATDEIHSSLILVLDELNVIVGGFDPKQLKTYQKAMVTLLQMCRGCNMAIWVCGAAVTLEHLGLTGETNRSIFRGAVAVGDDRDGVKKLCEKLNIPTPDGLPPGRFWLTESGNHAALAMPPIPNYAAWESVPNLRDMRGTRRDRVEAPTPQQPGYANLFTQASENAPEVTATPHNAPTLPPPPPSRLYRPDATTEQLARQFSLPIQEQLEATYQLPPVEGVEPPPNVSGGIEYPSELHRKLADYLQRHEAIARRAITQNWGKSKNLDTDDIWELLLWLQEQGLCETFSPEGSTAEWVRWKGSTRAIASLE